MRPKKLLTGVNHKCRQCVCSCKQFEQVTVIYCPHFFSISKLNRIAKNIDKNTFKMVVLR